MHDLESDEFIVGGIGGGDEEERGISAIDDLRVWFVMLSKMLLEKAK